MRPWVQIPSTTSILFRLYVLSFELECEKNENKKRVRDLHILIKKTIYILIQPPSYFTILKLTFILKYEVWYFENLNAHYRWLALPEMLQACTWTWSRFRSWEFCLRRTRSRWRSGSRRRLSSWTPAGSLPCRNSFRSGKIWMRSMLCFPNLQNLLC